MYTILNKLLNNGKIVGYTLKDTSNNILNIRKEDSIKYVDSIYNAYIRKDGCIGISGTKALHIKNIDVSKVLRNNTENKRYKFRDWSNLKIRTDIQLDGISKKLVVEDTNREAYILKFSKEKLGIKIYDHITEYIACKFAKQMGYSVQEVELGYYNNEECVILKMFDKTPITFGGLGYSSADGSPIDETGKNYNLDWLLKLSMNNKFSITHDAYRKWVWKVFILDMMVSNFDRHENNWGFKYNSDRKYEICPLFDMGASFYPKYILGDEKKLFNEKYKKHNRVWE